jgi:hypothetical protein
MITTLEMMPLSCRLIEMQVKMGKVLSLTTTKMTIAGTEEMIKSLFIP